MKRQSILSLICIILSCFIGSCTREPLPSTSAENYPVRERLKAEIGYFRIHASEYSSKKTISHGDSSESQSVDTNQLFQAIHSVMDANPDKVFGNLSYDSVATIDPASNMFINEFKEKEGEKQRLKMLRLLYSGKAPVSSRLTKIQFRIKESNPIYSYEQSYNLNFNKGHLTGVYLKGYQNVILMQADTLNFQVEIERMR